MARGHIRPARSAPGREGKAWTIHYRDSAGAQHQETVQGGRRAAQQALTQRLRAVDTGTHAAAGGLTVEEYLRRWLEDSARLSLAPQSYRSYRCAVNNWAAALGRHRLDRLSPLHIQEAIRLAEEADLSPVTIQRYHVTLHRALRQAVEWNLIPFNPADRVTLPRRVRFEGAVLTEEECVKLLAAALDDTYGLLILLGLGLGLRLGEALGLRWGDVDLVGGQVTVRRSMQAIDRSVKDTKSGRIRQIPLPRFVGEHLRGEQARHEGERRAMGPGWNPEGYLIVGRKGRPVAIRSTEIMHRVCKRAGVRQVRLHDLRHTHATLLLSKGEDVKAVSEQLGHADVRITLMVYHHVQPAARQGLADRLDDAFRKP